MGDVATLFGCSGRLRYLESIFGLISKYFV